MKRKRTPKLQSRVKKIIVWVAYLMIVVGIYLFPFGYEETRYFIYSTVCEYDNTCSALAMYVMSGGFIVVGAFLVFQLTGRSAKIKFFK